MASSIHLSSPLLLSPPFSPPHRRRRRRRDSHHHNNPYTPPLRQTSTTTITSLLSLTKPPSSTVQIPLKLKIPISTQQQSHPNSPSEPLQNLLSPTRQNCESLSSHFNHLLRLAVHRHDFNLARAIHASILKLEDEDEEEDINLLNTLISSYIKLGQIVYAHNLFSTLSSPDVVSYTSMISAFAKTNHLPKAMKLFFLMRSSGIIPNSFTFVAILTVCNRLLNSDLGSQIHSLAIKMGYCSFVYVSNALMGWYLKLGALNRAMQLFEEMPQRDLTSWNTIISALVKDSQYYKAFELFREMQNIDRFKVDYFTVSSLLTASKECFRVRVGREIHAHALRIGLESDVSVNNALIGFYTNCGKVQNLIALFERMPVKDVITLTGVVSGYMEFGLVESAIEVFYKMPVRNCISYNALLAGLCKNGEGLRALKVFEGMLEEGMELSDFTLSSIINACAVTSEVKISEQVHGFVIKSGCGSNNSWIEAALIDMCTKCGRMHDAEKLFSKQSFKQNDPILWTSMICGFARNGQLNEAMSHFCSMQANELLVVDEVASTAALSVCGSLGFHEMGKQIHCYTLKSGFVSDVRVGNSILSMYSKCGNMEDALKFFSLMPEHDIVSWNGLITSHLLHRQGDRALDVWSKMKKLGVKPDSITLMLTISAYKYTDSNSLDSCQSLFRSMKALYGIEPTSEHYASMISVLGYWDCFQEAEEMIKNMSFEPDVLIWRALLDSCRLRSNTKLGRLAAKNLLSVEPKDTASYILVSNLYSASGRWHCSEKTRNEMRQKGLKKNPAQSWIIHQNKIHSFFARDKSHPNTKDIYSGLDILILECIKVGYVPDTSFVLHEVEENQKKDFLFYHSAKLAVTHGILMTKPGKPVRVVKNIHLCGDCHTFLKHVSTVTGRQISLRDASGFHCFRNGECSCRDYW